MNQIDLLTSMGGYVTVTAVFINHTNGKPYTFICPVEVAQTLLIDDMVVVDTVREPQIALVRSVDSMLNTGLLSPDIEYRYVFDKVALSNLQKLKKEFQNAVDAQHSPDELDLPDELDFLA